MTAKVPAPPRPPPQYSQAHLPYIIGRLGFGGGVLWGFIFNTYYLLTNSLTYLPIMLIFCLPHQNVVSKKAEICVHFVHYYFSTA